MYYSLKSLQHAYEAGEKLKFLFFWGHTPSADGHINSSCLSQWWGSEFIVENEQYSFAEQFMMAEKARLFGDKEMLEAIMKSKHPKEMKAYGRAIKGFNNEVWESICYDIVLRGNLAKFEQNQELLEFLKSHHNCVFVEASPVDRIWGIGLAQDHPNSMNPILWEGKNLLGFALTEVRDRLNKGQALN
ncbi:NADAR family protein [Paenibacillus glycanilyticus]|uniref:NADAR family protein n=1 Tax=Paenibacillus glycanilyticus TaxID=126569 RepID=UPI002040D619|nr:NADAR family protein [Paenibacillus glycanilyticus]MCM3629347.1 NADAR family protein [Paenibacillus glycanilyticus]